MTANTAPPGSDPASVTSEPRVPLEFAWKLCRQFLELSAYLDSAQERKNRLYAYLQGAYFLGYFYRQCPDEYRRFSDLHYWQDVRQKPKRRNVMRSVLAFSMDAKEPSREALRNRIYKYAAVLEYFFRNDVLSDDVPRLLQDGGGVDAIYVEACRDAKRSENRGDKLEGTTGELPQAYTGDGATDSCAVAVQADRLGGDGSVRRLAAANDPTDTRSGEAQAGTSKRGQHHGVYRKVKLEVEMFEFELEEVLHAKRATICTSVQPPVNRGWRPVLAEFVFTSNRTDGPWPGHSIMKRDPG